MLQGARGASGGKDLGDPGSEAIVYQLSVLVAASQGQASLRRSWMDSEAKDEVTRRALPWRGGNEERI